MQVLVIGAGVIGLCVARAAALAGHDVIVAEAADAIGTGISSRNSEVIHAGMYYPTGSLRGAALCRARQSPALRFLRDPRRRRTAAAASSSSRPMRPSGRGSKPSTRKARINGVEGLD